MQRMLRDAVLAGKKKPSYWGLCLTAGQDGSTVAMQKVGSAPAVSLETSFSGKDDAWTPFTIGSTTITLNKGESVFFRAGDGGTAGDGLNLKFGTSATVYNKFVLTGSIAASGDISSILDRSGTVRSFAAQGSLAERTFAFVDLFRDCTVLTSAPELPAVRLAGSSYRQMFYGCTSLTAAPVLPAFYLATYTYQQMFYGCSSLSYVDVAGTSFGASDMVSRACRQWLSGVSSSGTIRIFDLYGDNNTAPRGVSFCPEGWTVETKKTPYFGVSGGNIYLNDTSGTQYSEDGGETWNDWSGTGSSYLQSFNALYLLAAKTPRSTTKIGSSGLFKGYSGGTTNSNFTCVGGDASVLLDKAGVTQVGEQAFYNMFYQCRSLKICGNILDNLVPVGSNAFSYMFSGCQALVKGPTLTTSVSDSCCVSMFFGCTALVNAPALPATALASSCYLNMFATCTSLVNAPTLPAAIMASSCYRQMFSGCSSLVNAPVLSATNLAPGCYQRMFQNCTALASAPTLPATSAVSDHCYSYMFNGCTALTSTPSLPATTVGSYSYEYMFNGCTALTSASSLPATSVGSYGYQYMFNGCKALTAAPSMSATSLQTYCCERMFNGCTALTSASVPPATSLATYCYRYMYAGCTSLVTPPSLPATTLRDTCYGYMFIGCTALASIPTLGATTLAASSYYSMFAGCTSLTNVAVSYTTSGNSCCNLMFSGCTGITSASVTIGGDASYCCFKMFAGCTSLTTAYVSSPNSQGGSAFSGMFRDCSSLSDITTTWTAWPTDSIQWVYGVAASGTFRCPTALGTDATISRGDDYAPNNWTVVNT